MKHYMKFTTMLAIMLFGMTAWAGDKTVGDMVDDGWILTKVNAELVGYEAQNINVEVHQGKVLLAGFVSSDTTRDAAVDLTGKVKGVKQVIDHLQVQDHSRTAGTTLDDGVLAGKVKAGLAENDRTDALDINVEVRDGVVLLSGFVDSSAEAHQAIKLTQNIEGVNDVLDGMEVNES